MPRKDLETSALSYRKHPGMGSSGVCSFTSSIAQNIYVEGLVVIMFAWHAMNGFRIIFMEFFKAAERGCFKKWLAIFTVLAILLAAVGLYYVYTYIAAN